MSNTIKLKESSLYSTLDEFGRELLDYSMNRTQGYSKFQMENFVINPAITNYRKMDQVMLEIESRTQVERTIVMEIKTNKIKIDMLKEDIESFEGRKGNKHLLEIELERLEYDLVVNTKRHKQAFMELETLISIVSDNFETTEEVVSMLEDDIEEKEEKYWVTRMAKQAAMDMVSSGRIGVGNMDAIAGMPEDKQVETLAVALQYNQRLNDGMSQINSNVLEGLHTNEGSLPKFDVPSITDKLLVKLDDE